jgi:hypothetical protein
MWREIFKEGKLRGEGIRTKEIFCAEIDEIILGELYEAASS